MRPVNKGPNNAGYTPPATFTFRVNSIAAKIFATTTPTTAVCLQQWYDAIWMKAQKKRPANYNDELVTEKAVISKVEDVYKTASVPLVQRLGSYCSYCETPVPGLLEVEHIAPKAVYPVFSLDWTNFLISCGPCNVAKSNTPSRKEAAVALGIGYTKTAPTQLQCQTYIRNDAYIWPDIDDMAYRWLPPDLYWYDAGTHLWNPLPVDVNNSSNLNNTMTGFDIATRTVTANIYIGGVLHNGVEVGVMINNTTNAVGQATIDLLDLDGLNPTQASTYDRRMINRTQAWFTVLLQMRTLSMITDQAVFDTIWPFIPMSAVGAGFYSVWVRILNTMVDPGGTNLATRFITDTNLPNMYPNTVTTNMP